MVRLRHILVSHVSLSLYIYTYIYECTYRNFPFTTLNSVSLGLKSLLTFLEVHVSDIKYLYPTRYTADFIIFYLYYV